MLFFSLHNVSRAALVILAILVIPVMARADADADWKAIVALDGGPGGNAQDREDARRLLIQHFDRQEHALRSFIAAYPADPHNFEAHMRLSHLLAIRSDIEGNPAYYAAARKVLDDLEKPGAGPADKLADVDYARITLFMHNMLTPDTRERDALMAYVRKFQKDFPADHRVGALLAEMATLYNSDPETQRGILEDAMRYADNNALKSRINDDFKRLAMLNRPLDLKFDSIQGASVDVARYKGKVVLVYFFANWATPSVMALPELKRMSDELPRGKFQMVGISLDKTREALDTTLKRTGIDCPIFFDGKGWESPLVRSLGINAIPAAWLVDREGNVRSLDAIDRTEALIRSLIEEN